MFKSPETQLTKEISDEVSKISPFTSVTLAVGECSAAKNCWYGSKIPEAVEAVVLDFENFDYPDFL